MYGPLLESVRTLRWHAMRAARANLPGAHPSRRRGTSAEFAEYRPYRQGDPLPRVDWKLFARTDRAYLRLSTDRAVVPTVIVVDASASMDFPAGPATKLQRARELAVALAAIAHRGGDPTGVAVSARRASVFAPRTRAGVVREIAAILDGAKPARGSAVAEAVTTASRLCARLVVISDFLDDEEDVLAAVRVHRARGGEVHAIHVVAAEELAPATGVAVHDPETPDDRRVLRAADRARYDEAFARWREELARRFRAAGATYTLSVTETPVVADVRAVVTAGTRALAR